MRTLCALGRHRPQGIPVWNDGYYFSTCKGCGRDLVRTAFEAWHVVPPTHRVVWAAAAPENVPSARLADMPAEPRASAEPAASVFPWPAQDRRAEPTALPDGPAAAEPVAEESAQSPVPSEPAIDESPAMESVVEPLSLRSAVAEQNQGASITDVLRLLREDELRSLEEDTEDEPEPARESAFSQPFANPPAAADEQEIAAPPEEALAVVAEEAATSTEADAAEPAEPALDSEDLAEIAPLAEGRGFAEAEPILADVAAEPAPLAEPALAADERTGEDAAEQADADASAPDGEHDQRVEDALEAGDPAAEEALEAVSDESAEERVDAGEAAYALTAEAVAVYAGGGANGLAAHDDFMAEPADDDEFADTGSMPMEEEPRGETAPVEEPGYAPSDDDDRAEPTGDPNPFASAEDEPGSDDEAAEDHEAGGEPDEPAPESSAAEQDEPGGAAEEVVEPPLEETGEAHAEAGEAVHARSPAEGLAADTSGEPQGLAAHDDFMAEFADEDGSSFWSEESWTAPAVASPAAASVGSPLAAPEQPRTHEQPAPPATSIEPPAEPAPKPAPAARAEGSWPSAAPSAERTRILGMDNPSQRRQWLAPALIGVLLVFVLAWIVYGLANHGAGRLPALSAASNAAVEAAPHAGGKAFVAVRLLACRASPTDRAHIVRVLPRGAAVRLLTRQGAWDSIAYQGRQCWVWARFVSQERPL